MADNSILSLHELTGEVKTSTVNPLSRKINKILGTRLENDKDTLDALQELSTFFSDNTQRSRSNLRGQIERRSVAINEEFVNALRDVKNAVNSIYTDVNEMNRECDEMKSRLQATKAETSHLIHQTNSLQKQSHHARMKEEVVRAFQREFQLSHTEVDSLNVKCKEGDSISLDFFKALDRMLTIRENTNLLLQTGHQKTSLDIMEQMTGMRESALERLFRWVQGQTRVSEPSVLLPQAMLRLEERPTLFNLVIEEWCVVRKGWLTRAFLDALTLGGPSGAPRPIELQAHEPLRYVGDMLAWVHQALPGEREAAASLFSQCKTIDVNETILSCVRNVSESVVRPLKTRVEQVVVSEQGRDSGRRTVNLYKISSLLHFYMDTISKVTGPGVLVATLKELQQLSHKMFLSALQNQVSHSCEHIEPPDETLSPSGGVSKTLSLLTEVVTSTTVMDDAGQDINVILDCVLDPLLNGLSECASGLGPTESSIYLLNCLHQLHSTFGMINTPSQKMERIQGQIDAQLDTLANEQINAAFHALALAPMYHVIMDQHPPTPLAEHPACQPLAVQSFVGKLDTFLSSPDHLNLPSIRFLLSSSIRKQLHSKTVHALLVAYERLHFLVLQTENGYHEPQTLVYRSPDMVKSLLL